MPKKQNIWDITPISQETENKILSHIGAKNSDSITILDFGAGSGRYTQMFSKNFPNATLYAVEVENNSIPFLKQLTPHVLQPKPTESTLPYKDDTFDYIFSSNVIEHIPHNLYLNYISELYRVLKPGGKFLVGAPNYPIKRLYDMKKVLYHLLKGKFSTIKYYLFDDPTHVNKLNVLDYEKDFLKYFKEVNLLPTEIFFTQNPTKNKHLMRYCNKFFGECIK